MEKLIERCNTVLDEVATKKSIPYSVWKKCKGVCIITHSELGFIFSVSGGEGIVVKKNDDGTWGAPSALTFAVASGGLIFGKADKQIFLFPMTEHGLNMLCRESSGAAGLQAGIAAGSHGREFEAGITMGDHDMGLTYSYTFEKGAMINVGYNQYMINAATHVNKDFYANDTAKPVDIVMTPGAVEIPTGKGIEELHEKLKALST
jgi:lipid-binding SYLF domain-containing protein